MISTLHVYIFNGPYTLSVRPSLLFPHCKRTRRLSAFWILLEVTNEDEKKDDGDDDDDDDDDDMVVPIENVLATKDPSILDENEWEEFALSDVKVYQADRKRYASILSASESHPVIAIGKLNVSKEQRSFGMAGLIARVCRVRFLSYGTCERTLSLYIYLQASIQYEFIC